MENQENKKPAIGLKKLISSQLIVLLLGTLFAWINFIREFILWQSNKPCKTGCNFNIDTTYSLTPIPTVQNPFLTPCFYGAIFFTVAFVLSIIIVKKFNKINNIVS